MWTKGIELDEPVGKGIVYEVKWLGKIATPVETLLKTFVKAFGDGIVLRCSWPGKEMVDFLVFTGLLEVR